MKSKRRRIAELENTVEDLRDDNDDLYLAWKSSEQEVEDLHAERHAERELVFDLLEHLQALVGRCP